MKRSFINQRIQQGLVFCREEGFSLPVWADWTPQQWATLGGEGDEIRRHQLGWDITDFGSGRYHERGLLLFTIRNGMPHAQADWMGKDYCEKILIIGEGQETPIHFHWAKMEDIINRSGGTLVLELWMADPESEERIDHNDVTASIDGIEQTFAAGEQVFLKPGQSITLPPYLYHRFYAEPGGGAVLAGEVSRVNDDENDNRFHETLPRFPAIEEDESARYLLCYEYPPAKGSRAQP